MVAEAVVTPEVRAMVGKQSEPETGPDEVCKSEIRRWVQATMDGNPLWYDEQYAQSTKFGLDYAPAPLILSAAGFYKRPLGTPDAIGKEVNEDLRPDVSAENAIRIPWPADMVQFHGSDEVEFYQLPRIGDTITVIDKVVDVAEKSGRSGKLGLSYVDRVYTNQRGEVLAITHHVNIARERHGQAVSGQISNKEQPGGLDSWRGKTVAPKNSCYDGIAVGDELPEVEQLVTIPVMQRWCSVTENLRRDHYDSKHAVEHDGLPGAVLSGLFSQAYLWAILFNWVGPDGWVFKIYQKNAAGVQPGDVLTFIGRVTNKEVKNGLGYLELNIGLRKQDGSVPIPGTATVVLPLTNGRPVPHPFKP